MLIYIILCLCLCLLLILIVNKHKPFELFNVNKKKIALCFLIYEEIYHEDLWYEWLNNIDKNKYNIYIQMLKHVGDVLV